MTGMRLDPEGHPFNLYPKPQTQTRPKVAEKDRELDARPGQQAEAHWSG